MKLDLRSAYKFIGIKEGDEWKTAFSTSTGHYDYLVQPYGLAMALSIFQAYINEVLREFLGRSVVAYIDDIWIYSPSRNQHVRDVWAMLQTLLENHLYCKAEKCEFHHKEVDFLGYAIQQGSVSMQPGKVEAVKMWPRPLTRKALQHFLSFANFYRRFITDQLRGPVQRFKWTQEVNKALEELKNAFATTPILQQPDPERPFVMEVDASDMGVGAVLWQHPGERGGLRPIAYFSRKLSSAERNYGVGDRELLAMKLAFEE
ncbi:hypothetical protein P4O66_002181 [Electrophorus voltai]|uniref:ribonuclease H n=1 Tax=Electrophorus voltai TaxID=2609070 RepID=A0AAD8Z1C6_9TELE|nr:hypothetical protein P4O66_002181 [Electrophorus voltai]